MGKHIKWVSYQKGLEQIKTQLVTICSYYNVDTNIFLNG